MVTRLAGAALSCAGVGLLALTFVAPAANAATNNIFTVAGTSFGLSGDGGPATAAQLNSPTGVAVTADGGYLIADGDNHRVRRVSPAGTITTVAGTTGGLSGDGGPATAAQLSRPLGVAVTADGGFLIADTDNDRVRFVHADLRGPASGPPGPAGPQGPEGPAGPRGPAGAPGAAFDRLTLALATDRVHARARQRVKLRYSTTTAATIELRLVRGSRRVASVCANAQPGRNTIRLRAPSRPRRYRVELIAATGDGQRATDRARLTVTRGGRER
jgi:DNA-binding beta-propeller fold protein YncE